MELKGKRIAIFVDTLYQEMELWVPLYRFQEAGAHTVTIGPKAGATYTSKLGYPATAETSYDEVSAADFDGLIVPGGYAPDHMRRHAKALAFVRETNDQGKLIAAICHALWVPASAGILKGRRVTSFFAIKDQAARLKRGFPASLDGERFLYPEEQTVLRRSLDQYFEDNGIHPLFAAEFADSALAMSFCSLFFTCADS